MTAATVMAASVAAEAPAAALERGPMCDNLASRPMEPTPPVPDSPDPTRRPVATRADLRNVAIVAHVDHGKTTLVDAMLRQTGAFRANQAVVDRVMDSGDLEREKGITILAKQTTVDHDGVRLNIVDTPGHADFGGEVERSLLMVDSVLLLVDAAEGPLPQTRYVLQKAMARRLPVVVALNKIDRGDARPAEVLDDVYELFMDLGADEHQIEFPIVYTNAKAGHGDARPRRARARTCGRCSTCSSRSRPPPTYDARPPAPAARHQPVGQRLRRPDGRRADLERHDPDRPADHRRPRGGRRHRRAPSSPAGRSPSRGTVTSLQTAHGIERVDIEEAGPGDIVSVAGLPEVTIGDTLTDPADPRPLPRLDVDAPTLRMTFGVNTSPLAGREGKYVTQPPDQGPPREGGPRQRLDRGPPDRVERDVRGPRPRRAPAGRAHRADAPRGLRADRVAARRSSCATVDGEVQEPYERITIDIPPDYIGEVQTAHGRPQGPPRADDRPTPTAASGWSSSCRSAGSSAIAASS